MTGRHERQWTAPLVFLLFLLLPAPPGSRAGRTDEDPRRVVLEIGQQKITVGDFLLYVQQINPLMEFEKVPANERRRLLDEFVTRKLFALRAREAGLGQAPEVRARIDFFVDGVLAQEFKDRQMHDIAVTEDEVVAYYRSHPEEFKLPPRFLLQHLLYKNAEKAARAQASLKQGTLFSGLAQQKESDPDLLLSEHAWFTPALLIPELANTAFQLHDGDVSDVIRSSHGYHVLRLEAHEEGRIQDVGEVRSEVLDKVRQVKASRMDEEVLKETKARPQVRLHVDRLPP